MQHGDGFRVTITTAGAHMYNKLFSKILDSSIWLAPDPHRLVWITIIAAMDEDGNVMFASAANLAARARVSLEAAREAIAAFEAPDPDSGDPDNEGRRIERIPGGWHVLNAHKYRGMVTRIIAREQTRLRTQAWRQRQAVTVGDAPVTQSDEVVTPSETVSVSDTKAEKEQKQKSRSRASRLPTDWQPSAELMDWATQERPDLDLRTTLDGFRDYWTAKAGRDATKADWGATWRNWVRNQRPPARNGPAGAPAKVGKVRQAYDAISDAIERMNHGGEVVSDGDGARDTRLPALRLGGAAGN